MEAVAQVIKEWLAEMLGENNELVREFSLEDFELSSFEKIHGSELVRLVELALARRC